MGMRTTELAAFNYPGKVALSAAVLGDCIIYNVFDLEQVGPAFFGIDAAWPTALRVQAMIGHDLTNWHHFPPSDEFPTGVVEYSTLGAKQLLNVAPYQWIKFAVSTIGTAAQIGLSARGVRDE